MVAQLVHQYRRMTEQSTYLSYQLSTIGIGVLATGLADVRQSIDIILRTIPGSDPLRPSFGCNVWRFVDAPAPIAIPNMKKAIVEALQQWEKRITVNSIDHEEKVSQVDFLINYNVIDTDIRENILLSTTGNVGIGGDSQGIILSAVIPLHIANGRYNVSLIINNNSSYPTPPQIGFGSTTEMLTWLQTNWQTFGNWYLAAGKLVLYLNSQIEAKSATLRVTQTAILTSKVLIPLLGPGEFYSLSLIVDGGLISGFPPNIFNVEALLFWLENNWNEYGNWYIQSQGDVNTDADFNEDFGGDFATGGITPIRYLVFQTNKYETAEIAFN